jgi:8-oxo-dGTP diphosphatase
MDDYKHPRVGVGVMVLKDNKVLIGKRKSSHGEGEYAWPGGHLEHLESVEECARREVREEAGIEIKNIKFLRLMNITKYAPKHFIDIAMVSEWESGEPQVLEPHKLESWEWRDMNDLPQPLFAPLPTYFEALKTGRTFWDA